MLRTRGAVFKPQYTWSERAIGPECDATTFINAFWTRLTCCTTPRLESYVQIFIKCQVVLHPDIPILNDCKIRVFLFKNKGAIVKLP
jgi:hypothetical protein